MEALEGPLILLIGGQPDHRERVRGALKGAGFLPATTRSVQAAAHLILQVRVDGCVCLDTLPEASLPELTARLDEHRPSGPRLWLCPDGSAAPAGWTACAEPDLPGRLWAFFRGQG